MPSIIRKKRRREATSWGSWSRCLRSSASSWDASRLRRQGPAVDPSAVETGQIVHLDTDDALQGQDSRRRRLPVHAGDVYVGVIGEVVGEALGVAPLRQIVELPAERHRKLRDKTGQVVVR